MGSKINLRVVKMTMMKRKMMMKWKWIARLRRRRLKLLQLRLKRSRMLPKLKERRLVLNRSILNKKLHQRTKNKRK